MVTLTADPSVTGRALYCVNQILQRNEKILWIVISMALAIFILGISLLLIGFIAKDWRILAPSSIVPGLLYWPIKMIQKMRVENMVLLAIALVPVESLPPEKAAEQIGKVIDRILKYDEKK